MRAGMLGCVCVWAMAASAVAQEPLALGTLVGNVPISNYDNGGRRDPFVSLMTPGKAVVAESGRGRTGLASMSLADVSVKGMLRAGGDALAVLEGPDGRSFVVRSRDKLQDAIVKSIDRDGVVFVEQEDAGGAIRARDIRKPLKPMAEGVR